MALQVGISTLTPVIELDSVDFPDKMFFGEDYDERGVNPHLDWLAPRFYHRRDRIVRLSHHAWLVDNGRHKILIDPCVGNHKPRKVFEFYNMLDLPWLERLEAAGARPEEIDFVFCTHLHVDHCGWNTRLENGRWVPTFPNARYIFSRQEVDYWARDLAGGLELENEFNSDVYADSILPVIRAGQALIIDGGIEVADCLAIEPGPGHTAGHMIATFRSGNGGACFAGDAIHHPLQVVNPDWCTPLCDKQQARLTRRRILDRCADEGLLLAPAHFRAPHAFRVVRRGDSFRLQESDR